MVKIALDAGHGINTPGKRSPADEREWSFNNRVLLATVERLNQYQNVSILRLDDPTGRRDVPLVERTNKANRWKANVLVSIHHNANTAKWGSWTGVETFTQPGSQRASVDIARIVHGRIVKAMGLRDRGHKLMNLHMVRESTMPAILTEGGFMDSTIDIKALRNNSKLKAQGYAIADGLAQYFKLSFKSGANTKPPVTKPPVVEKEKDIMSEVLPKTQRDDIGVLLKRALNDGIFHEDHTKNINNMTRGKGVDLLISYISRTESKRTDNMWDQLPVTQQEDIKKLLKKAYDEGIFHEDHSKNVSTMSWATALGLLISYVSRTEVEEE